MQPTLFLTLLFTLLVRTALADEAAAANAATSKVVAAAKSFLVTLNPEQRRKVQFGTKNEDQRKRWSNLPTGIFKRDGLRLGDLSESQQAAAWALLQSALSPSGYEKVRRIVEADEILAKDGSPKGLK